MLAKYTYSIILLFDTQLSSSGGRATFELHSRDTTPSSRGLANGADQQPTSNATNNNKKSNGEKKKKSYWYNVSVT